MQVQGSNGLAKVSHTKYRPQKGGGEGIYKRSREGETQRGREQDMTPKYGPFPATNNNTRLVFFLPFVRVFIHTYI